MIEYDDQGNLEKKMFDLGLTVGKGFESAWHWYSS